MENPRRYGSSPFAVAVIHGGPGAPGSAVAVARELGRYVGALEPLQSAATIEGQVEELRAQLRGNEVAAPVTLIGHSWGAWLALIVAARYPELVKKLIMVGAGPFEARYAEGIMATRLGRLSEGERVEALGLIEGLQAGEMAPEAVERLGALLARTDAYDPIPGEGSEGERGEDGMGEDELPFQPEVHRAVWREAAEMRRSGELLARARGVRCPVVAIHGDYDPHPYQGVAEPLAGILGDFRFVLLERCGHEPWRERQARERFFEALRGELGEVSGLGGNGG